MDRKSEYNGVLVKEVISGTIPSLSPEDTGREALALMEVFRVEHLAVVEGKNYIGTISGRAIYINDLSDRQMSDCLEWLSHAFAHHHQHVYELLPVFADSKISLLPVLDDQNAYLGVVPVFSLLDYLAEQSKGLGGMIVLEMSAKDYFLSQIARIVEENDAKILNLHVSVTEKRPVILVTLKLNIADLSSVIQSFIRFDYTIYGIYADHSGIRDLYHDRYEQLMKYLNI